MTCEICTKWCATTEQQLEIRQKNMVETPAAQPYPCPQCGSMEWATTRAMIREPEVAPKRWWQRRLPVLSWPAIIAMNAFTMVLCISGAIVTEHKWLIIVNSVAAGAALAGIGNAAFVMRMKRSLDSLSKAFDAMAEFNQALIADKVGIILQGHEDRRSDGDDTLPTAPKLH